MKQNLLIDYLVMSFKISDKQACFLDFLLNKIKFPLVDAIHIRSFYGLGDCLYYSGIKVHYDKSLVILDCSGKGCRTLEQLDSDWNWGSFLAIFDKFLTVPIKDSDYGGNRGVYAVHISRIDLACDLLDDDRITIPFLQGYVRKNKFICKSQYHSCIDGNKELAIYFGSPRSSRRLRIYDKALEQHLDGKRWVRFEFQLRDDNATSFYLNLSKTCNGNFSKCYYGMLHDFLRFITVPNDGIHSNRKKVCPFWLHFLKGVDKIKQLYLPGNRYDVGKALEIFNRQCSSTARLLVEAFGGVDELLASTFDAKLNKKQKDALQAYKIQRRNAEEQALWDEAASENSQKILECIGHTVVEKGTVDGATRRQMLKDKVAADKAKIRDEYYDFWDAGGGKYHVLK